MYRRVICLVVLAGMIVHCAARLGVLSYVYEKRHNIALSVGLIAEIPIATCSHDYDFGNGLVFNSSSSDDQKAPSSFSTAREIILFLQTGAIAFEAIWQPLNLQSISYPQSHYKSTCLLDIFHPPSIAS
jgi:hypothetical protein